MQPKENPTGWGRIVPVSVALFLSMQGALAQTGGAGDTAALLPPPSITFTTWTGPYMRSQILGVVRPYEAAEKIRVDVAHYSGGISEIRDQVESANVIWDVVDLTQADLLRACEEGLLEDLSDIDLPDGADGTAAAEDFVDGALNACGVGNIVWATAFAYSNAAFGDRPPTSIADFFDTRSYPGPRAIRNDPTVIMEWALMADGVARDDVYAALETEQGVERALARMDAIRPGLHVWENGREPVRLLNADEVVMSSIWATTGAVAADEPGADFSIVYDGRVIELDFLGIPMGSRHKDAAIRFIRYASGSAPLASMVSYLPNGPARASSLAMLSDEMLARIPNGPAYDDKLHIMADAEWWAHNHARLAEAFQSWLSAPRRHGAAGTTR